MIGVDRFSSVFGGQPQHTAEHLTEHLRAVIRAGYSPVLCKPGGKETACILSVVQAKRADKEARERALAANPAAPIDRIRHACGMKHVIDDPAKVGPIVKRFLDVHGGLNVGLHLGRSRTLVVDVDTPAERAAFVSDFEFASQQQAPGITVESPGTYDYVSGTWKHWGGGHWWFDLPDEFVLPPGKVLKLPGGPAIMYGESYALVPPASRPEGAYRLVGGANPSPAWILETLTLAGEVRAHTADQNYSVAGGPIDQWSARTSWASLLEPQGWIETSMVEGSCGCPVWTAPGDHASPKSATAHDLSCARFDVSEGWGPLKIWTDHPPDGLPPSGAVTKLQFVALTGYGGSDGAAMSALGIERPVAPAAWSVPAEWQHTVTNPLPASMSDPFGVPGPPDPSAPQTTPGGSGVRLSFTWANQLRQRASRWLWEEDDRQWIPLGGLVLLGGREGVGKSTLAFKLAAGVTLGTLPGDYFGVPKSVVIVATEDAWEQTIQPRLIAAGADLRRVARANVSDAGFLRGLSLPEDTQGLRDGCAVSDVALVILDPLLSTIGGRLDTHKDSDVRKALEPLSRMAADLQLTVIGLIHQNKSTGSDILTRLMGSRAFSAVARAVLLCAREAEQDDLDVDDDEFATVINPQRDRFVFGQLKSNLGPPVLATIQYQIKGVVTGWDDELSKPIRSSVLDFTGTVEQKVTELVSDDVPARKKDAPASRAAGEWLLAYLTAHGPTTPAEVEEAPGCPARATLYRARKAFGIVSARVDGVICWSAPPAYITGGGIKT